MAERTFKGISIFFFSVSKPKASFPPPFSINIEKLEDLGKPRDHCVIGGKLHRQGASVSKKCQRGIRIMFPKCTEFGCTDLPIAALSMLLRN